VAKHNASRALGAHAWIARRRAAGNQHCTSAALVTCLLEISSHNLTLQIASAFGMRVIGWSPNLTLERAAIAGVEFVASKEELLKQSDVLSLHLVLSDATKHILKAADLAQMKPTAYLINTSRGPLVDESALLDALNSGKIAGAGLDVFDIEPLPLDHPIRKARNVTLSPHTGYISDTTYQVRHSVRAPDVTLNSPMTCRISGQGQSKTLRRSSTVNTRRSSSSSLLLCNDSLGLWVRILWRLMAIGYRER